MFCIHCGKEVQDIAAFCQGCGSKINSAEHAVQGGTEPQIPLGQQVEFSAASARQENAQASNYPLAFWVLGQIGFLLVIIGFFMPVISQRHVMRPFSDRTGFQFAGEIMDINVFFGLITYAVFASAIVGLGVGVFMMMAENQKTPTGTVLRFSGACISICILCVFIAGGLPRRLRLFVEFQSGAYVILIGLIVAVLGLIFAWVATGSPSRVSNSSSQGKSGLSPKK